MFNYVFCDGMKLIQDAIRLPLAWPYVDAIMGLWLVLLSEKPSSTSRVVGQQIAKMVFKLFNFYSYIIFGVGERDGGGGGVVKIRGGAELILLWRTGGHYTIISPLKLMSQLPPLIIITQSLKDKWFNLIDDV